MYQKTLEEEHYMIATSMNNLASLYKEQGKLQEAESLFIKALAIRKKTLGTDHSEVARSLENLADLYCIQAKYDKAESLLEESLIIMIKILGEDHPDIVNYLTPLFEVLNKQGKIDQFCQKNHRMLKNILGSDSPARAVIDYNPATAIIYNNSSTTAIDYNHTRLNEKKKNIATTEVTNHKITKTTYWVVLFSLVGLIIFALYIPSLDL